MHLIQRLRYLSRPLQGVLIGVLCALLVQGVLAQGWLRGVERGTIDSLFRLRGAQEAAPQIVLVIADEATVAHYNNWPLPRRAHAALVSRLHRAGAKTIAYDLLFTSPTTTAEDTELIRASRAAGNVVQAGVFQMPEGDTLSASDILPPVSEKLRHEPEPRFALGNAETSGSGANGSNVKFPQSLWLSTPLPALMQSAPRIGHVNFQPERDGTLRSIPHLIKYHDHLYPSLALAAALHFWELGPRDVRLEKDEILLTRNGRELARLPLYADGETAVNWSGGFRSLPSYSMVKVLTGEVAPEVFKNKIVLIGSTATGSFEWRATPFSDAQPPVELQANALDNILLNRSLRGVSSGVRFLLMLAFAIVMGALIAPRLDLGGTLWLLGGSVALWAVALVALAKFALYLPVAPAILAAALTYSLAMAMNYRDEWEANVRTDASVSALVRGGALVMASRNRKQLQKALCTTTREALFARQTFLIIDDRWNEEQPGHEKEFVQSLALAIKRRGRVAFYPTARDEKAYALDSSGEDSGELVSSLTNNGQWIAAPILSSHPRLRTRSGLPENTDASAPRTVRGVLIALGQVENRPFTARDAAVLEAIAEQAALALEVLEYAELLQSRVEWANRELREAYGVLSAQTAKFMAAVESMDEAFLICDAEHRAIFVNAAARPILREATPRLNDSVPETLRANGLPEVAALFDEMSEQGESLRHEYSCDDRVLAVQLTPLCESRSPDGQSLDGQRNAGAARTGSMLIISDVTAQRELDEMKTNFVGFVAHEIRSPLGTIMGYATMLQQAGAQDDPHHAEIMAAIERQCRRMNRLVNDMLDMARLDSGHAIELRPTNVPIVPLCQRVLHAHDAVATDLDLHFTFRCKLAGENIWGDPDRIEQILINLISNAVKYSPSGGEIVLALTENDQEVSICVSDQGMGMTPEQTENLFQKFYRTPDAKARGIKGTGLGLFLVKQLVEAHGGTIEVHSEPGQGTAFTVKLPKQPASKEYSMLAALKT